MTKPEMPPMQVREDGGLGLRNPFRRKKRDPLSAIERIQALEVRPGDVIICTVPRGTDTTLMADLQKMMNGFFKGIGARTMVAQKGMEISVVRSIDPPSPKASEDRGRAA